MMECNKDEAVRAKEIAERKFSEREYIGAKKFAIKAQSLYPDLEDVPQFLTTIDIYISAENKVSGEMDWYGILGVSPFADEETVRKQYRKLALTLHPDKNKSLGAEGAFKLVSEAWSLLSDKTKRLEYNQKRSLKGFQHNTPNRGHPSAPPSSNSYYHFKKNASSNVRSGNNNARAGNNNVRSPATSVPPPQKKAETFWTICNRCRTHYEYLSSTFLAILKLLIIFITAAWISLWILKPTQAWTRVWKHAEQSANNTIFGYYGLNFAVYTFPIIAIAIIGLLFLDLKAGYQRTRNARSSPTVFSNPLVVNSLFGILTSVEILVVFLVIVFLAWTYYARISNDFKKLMQDKSLKLNLWQLKYLRIATRFGLLAEACLALLLLPILRGLSVFRIFGIQFEASVKYHTWIGTAMILFATIHGASTLFVWGVSHHIQHEIWKWQKTGRIYLAGEIALVIGLVIFVTSLPQIRRRKFEIFYYTHHLYILFLVFFLFHAGDKHFYMVFPGVFLFSLDKLLRIIQSSPKTCIVSARIFPCEALELILPKDPRLKYNPTSVVYLKIPTISHLQWHSFSIISSSKADENIMSVMIKCQGWWTNTLYDLIQTEINKGADKRKGIPVAIEGPYGPASLDFLKHDSVLMVAGGSGITPFLSILAEIDSTTNQNKFPLKIQLVHVIKRAQDVCLLHSITHLLLNQASRKFHLKLKLFVTQETQLDLGITELLNKFVKVKTLKLDSVSSKYYAAYGLESPVWMAAITGFCSITFLIFLICFNHTIIPFGKHSKLSKEKTPSWIVDLLLIASFVVALSCSALIAIVLRWRRLKKGIPPMSQKEIKPFDQSSAEIKNDLEEHEVHFGGRPNFKDILGKFKNETRGSNVGLLVCGPESMKESVAAACQQKSECFELGAKRTEPCFTLHSLNFTL